MSARRTLKVRVLCSVFDLEGKPLGRVDQLVIDVGTGRAVSVVLAIGRSAGAERTLAVPWEAVALDPEREAFLLNLPADTVLEAFGHEPWSGALRAGEDGSEAPPPGGPEVL